MRINRYICKMKAGKIGIVVMCLMALKYQVHGQRMFSDSDTLHRKRAVVSTGAIGGLYSIFSVGLYNTWYRKYEQESFHLFNDVGEWSNMDKYGHIYTAYVQGKIVHGFMRWAGLNQRRAIWRGVIGGVLFQSTLEVMDGFSAKWGFSLADMGSNVVGTSIFAAQQWIWDDQRIALKINSLPRPYPNEMIVSVDGSSSTTLATRAQDLYGKGSLERMLKDYNAQVYWLSINVNSMIGGSNPWPKYLNVALGYGADNMYGGFENRWEIQGDIYELDRNKYPRIHQFYIGLDIDYRRLGIKNPLLQSLAKTLDHFKVPSPTLEINSQGQVIFHILR
jgi:hypothetical protein